MAQFTLNDYAASSATFTFAFQTPPCAGSSLPSILPNSDRVQDDYAVLAELSQGLSGGNILNVNVTAIYAGSVDADPANWAVTQGMLEREIAKVKKAKAEHLGD